VREDALPFVQAIAERGAVADIQQASDGLSWLQRVTLRLAGHAYSVAQKLANKARTFWRDYVRDGPQETSRDDHDERER
jgi:hypothetical protein